MHVFFDLHSYITDAYICTVHMTEESGTKYCEILDTVNIQAIAKGAYTDSDNIADFVGEPSKLATQAYVMEAIGLLDTIIGTGVIE